MTTKQQIIRAAAEAIEPKAFSNDPGVAHRFASPLRVDIVQSQLLAKAEAALNATPIWELLEHYEAWKLPTDNEAAYNDIVVRLEATLQAISEA